MSKTENNNNKPFDDIEFKSLIIAFKGILIIFFIVISLVLVFSIQTQAITQNIDYTFNNDYIYNSNEGLDYTNFNIRNQTIITQPNYTATYDFLDIPIDTTGIDIDFIDIDSSTGNCLLIIKDNEGHSNTLKCLDYNEVSSLVIGRNNLNDITFGTIEFWFLTSDGSKDNTIAFLHGIVLLFSIRADTDQFQYYDGSWNNLGLVPLDNIWYHIRVDFECTLGSYSGLSQYDYSIRINDVEYGNYNFASNEPHMDIFGFQTASADQNYNLYIDAIGYSWDIDYEIGQNIAYPTSTITSIQEIDKCEFAYNLTTFEPNIPDAYIIDNNWIENDDSTNLHVKQFTENILIDYGYGQEQNYYGISKEFDYNNDNIFNISFNINEMDLCSPYLDGWYFNIYSYDDTLLVSLLFNGSDTFLYYYDGSNYISIHDLQVSSTEPFSFNIYINNRVILRLNDSDVIYTWYFSELTSNIGINKIEIIGGTETEIGDLSYILVDSIGLYINGSSYLPDDLLGVIINTDISYWYDNIHNLFEINGLGNFSFSVFYNTIYQDTIIPFSEFNGILKRVFYIDSNIDNGFLDYEFQLISNVSFTISEIKVYANSIKESSNIYYPSFTYNEVDIKENYFYIQNNRLYYTHNANQNDTLEYIQVSFNIDNEYALNSSVNFNSYFLGISKAYFSLNYVSETSTIYSIPISHESYNDILPQQQIINSFTFLITDNDNNDYYGNSEGYFSSIKLIYYPDIELTILTISLVEMIIPLIILIIPTLAISFIAGKKAIIPMLILMSIICYIAELIELELLAIILICLGSFLFIQYKTEKKVN